MCMTLERIELIVEEPVWQEAKYIVGHVTTLGLGLEVPYRDPSPLLYSFGVLQYDTYYHWSRHRSCPIPWVQSI